MKLSPRQTQILDQLASGKCAKEAAAALGITVTTVEKLLGTARRRNRCRTTVQLIADRHRAEVEDRDARLAGCVEGAEIVLAAASGKRRAPVAALGLVVLLGGLTYGIPGGFGPRSHVGGPVAESASLLDDPLLFGHRREQGGVPGTDEATRLYWLSSARGSRGKLHAKDCRYVKQGVGGEWFDRLEDAPATCERCKRCLGEE